MKILWLCSWYPHSTDRFDGDFIERQAKALSEFQQMDIIHLVQNASLLTAETYRTEVRTEKNLHTKITYVPVLNTPFTKLNKALFNHRYYKQMLEVLKEYIQQNGKPDLVHVHVPVKMGAGALWLKRKYDIPFVVTEHSSAYFENIPENYYSRNRYFRLITKKSFENAEIVSSVSNWLLNRLGQMFSIKQTQLVRNAVDTSFFFPIAKTNSKNVFIHVSMMHPLKNASGILLALAQLNKMNTSWQMNFIGPASADNLKLSFELGLDKQVAWKGLHAYADVAKEMQQADALVHFSKYENLPCVINEAMCCGLPVISSNVGGIAELVNDSNGILVESENINQLAEAMAAFLQNPDRFNKQQISKEASALFNYSVIGKELLGMYCKVLKLD